MTDRLPGIHLSPAVVAMERRGIRTDRGDQARRRQHANARLAELYTELDAVEAELAALQSQHSSLER